MKAISLWQRRGREERGIERATVRLLTAGGGCVLNAFDVLLSVNQARADTSTLGFCLNKGGGARVCEWVAGCVCV